MTDPQVWIRDSANELLALIEGAGREDERVLQTWLERHPVFVPGYRGRRGMSSWLPWPSALITQPRLVGFEEKVPDFCWLSVDSAELTAMLIEIEKPAKRWQRGDGGQAAELTQARDQLNSWRTWFSRPDNAARFLDDYLVPDGLRDLNFTRHYVLVHGSRSEYENHPGRMRLRATMAASRTSTSSSAAVASRRSSSRRWAGIDRRNRVRFENDFDVDAPIEKVWDAVLDVERVDPTVPGPRCSSGSPTTPTRSRSRSRSARCR